MYEIIELYIICLGSFIFAFIAYILLALKYYERKIKKIEDMAPTVLDMIISSLERIETNQFEMWKEINELRVSVGKMKVKIAIYGSMVGALSSALVTWITVILK